MQKPMIYEDVNVIDIFVYVAYIYVNLLSVVFGMTAMDETRNTRLVWRILCVLV